MFIGTKIELKEIGILILLRGKRVGGKIVGVGWCISMAGVYRPSQFQLSFKKHPFNPFSNYYLIKCTEVRRKLLPLSIKLLLEVII